MNLSIGLSPGIEPGISLSHGLETWQLQTAKARFSELFRRARHVGPQLVTRQGKEGVVMLPLEQYEKLVARQAQPKSLVQFLRESPLAGVELDLERDPDPSRDVDLF